MSVAKREIHISKLLSKILRHQAENEQISIDSKGFASIDDLLKNNKFKSFKTTKDDIIKVCETNDKKRFEISVDGLSIRAVQGHSLKAINENEIYEQVTLKDLHILPLFNCDILEKGYFIIHGTSTNSYNLITKSGYLKKMNRTHIHFTFENNMDKEKVISGFRKNSQILIYINILDLLNNESFKDKVCISKNKVILVSEDIPTSFIHHHVTRLNT